MNYQYPKHMRMSKKEEEQSTKRVDELGTSFIKGMFFFITVPILIYNKLKNKK